METVAQILLSIINPSWLDEQVSSENFLSFIAWTVFALILGFVCGLLLMRFRDNSLHTIKLLDKEEIDLMLKAYDSDIRATVDDKTLRKLESKKILQSRSTPMLDETIYTLTPDYRRFLSFNMKRVLKLKDKAK